MRGPLTGDEDEVLALAWYAAGRLLARRLRLRWQHPAVFAGFAKPLRKRIKAFIQFYNFTYHLYNNQSNNLYTHASSCDNWAPLPHLSFKECYAGRVGRDQVASPSAVIHRPSASMRCNKLFQAPSCDTPESSRNSAAVSTRHRIVSALIRGSPLFAVLLSRNGSMAMRLSSLLMVYSSSCLPTLLWCLSGYYWLAKSQVDWI